MSKFVFTGFSDEIDFDIVKQFDGLKKQQNAEEKSKK